MAADNNNYNHPFPTGRGDPPNRPLDISSDLWTPISTGAPMPGTAKLYDAQSTVEQAPQTQTQTPSVPQKAPRKKGKQRPISKKRPENEKKKKPAPEKAKSARPKAKKKRKGDASLSEKRTLVASRAEELRRQTVQNKERRSARQQNLRAQKSREEFERRRQNGDSGDDIRRGKAQRKRKHKKLAAILTVFAVLVIAGIAVLVYCLTYGAPIASIEVTGGNTYEAARVIEASGVMPGDNMFHVNERSLNKRLCTLLPYIGSVEVKYHLPDVLGIEVRDTSDLYLISGKNAYLSLDKDRKILSLKKKKNQPGVFRLDGFDSVEGEAGQFYQPAGADAERFEEAEKIVAELLANDLQNANVIDLTDLNNIVIRYDGRINVYLGSTKNLAIRLRAAAITLREQMSENTIGYIEISHTGTIYTSEGTMTKD